MPSRDDERRARWNVVREEAHRLLKLSRLQEKKIASLERALEQERARVAQLQAEASRRPSRWKRGSSATAPVAAPASRRESPEEVVRRWLRLDETGPAVVLAIAPNHPRRAGALAAFGATALQLDDADASYGLPPALVPSPVPAALAGMTPARTRVLLALGATDGALRWLVPSQQEGWITVVDLDERAGIGPRERYLATHADVVVTGGDATTLSETLGVGVVIAPDNVAGYATLQPTAAPPSRALLEDA